MPYQLDGAYLNATAELKERMYRSRSEIVSLGLDDPGRQKPLPEEPSSGAMFTAIPSHPGVPLLAPADYHPLTPVGDVRELKQEHAYSIIVRCEMAQATAQWKKVTDAYPGDRARWEAAWEEVHKRGAAAERQHMSMCPKEPPPEPRPRPLGKIPCHALQGFCHAASYDLSMFLRRHLNELYLIKPVHVVPSASHRATARSTTEHYFLVAAPRWGTQMTANDAIVVDVTWAQFAQAHGAKTIPEFYPHTLVGTVDELRRSAEIRKWMAGDDLDALMARYLAGAYALADGRYNLW